MVTAIVDSARSGRAVIKNMISGEIVLTFGKTKHYIPAGATLDLCTVATLLEIATNQELVDLVQRGLITLAR